MKIFKIYTLILSIIAVSFLGYNTQAATTVLDGMAKEDLSPSSVNSFLNESLGTTNQSGSAGTVNQSGSAGTMNQTGKTSSGTTNQSGSAGTINQSGSAGITDQSGTNGNIMLGGGGSNSAVGAGLGSNSNLYNINGSINAPAGAPKLSLEGIVLWLVGILNQLVYVIIGASLVMFLYGIFMLSFVNGQKPESREQARKFMFWGIVSLFVIVSVWGLVRVLQMTFFGNGNLILPQLK